MNEQLCRFLACIFQEKVERDQDERKREHIKKLLRELTLNMWENGEGMLLSCNEPEWEILPLGVSKPIMHALS